MISHRKPCRLTPAVKKVIIQSMINASQTQIIVRTIIMIRIPIIVQNVSGMLFGSKMILGIDTGPELETIVRLDGGFGC